MDYQIHQFIGTDMNETYEVKKLGIQGVSNQVVYINNEPIWLGKTGIYEIEFPDDYYYQITTITSTQSMIIDMVVVVHNT